MCSGLIIQTLDWVLADLQSALKWDIEGVEWEWIPIVSDRGRELTDTDMNSV